MEKLGNTELQAIKEQAEKATKGVWYIKYGLDGSEVVCGDKRWLIAEVTRETDAEFIAAAREDVPKLLSLVAQQQAEIERLNGQLSELIGAIYDYEQNGTALLDLAERIDSE